MNSSTLRLYYEDSHLLNFEAKVLSCEPHNGNWAVVLDQTAFYPTGGGQPTDTGTLGDVRVLDCIDRETEIVHVVSSPVSGTVSGRIDPERRFDHLQQHTGQHILSQAFLHVAGAETRSFHLGVQASTIDVELNSVGPELIAEVENLANRIVFENRPVRIHLTDSETAGGLELRKDTDRQGCVRIIDIADFDRSPCGGTHARQTGEVGLVAVRSTEKVKGNLFRIEFLCGGRVLRDYKQAHATALATAAVFSTARDAAPELVAKLSAEHREAQRKIRELSEIACAYQGRELYDAEPEANGVRCVALVFTDKSVDELKVLAHAVVAAGPSVALLAAKGDANRLVFARSKSLTINAGQLMSEFCKAHGGRGGGNPEFAQGGVPSAVDLEPALSALKNQVLAKP